MTIDEIEVGTKYEDNLGKAKYSKNGDLVKGRLQRIVEITAKTANSIEYRDAGRFLSWITLDDFNRIENKINKVRFSKI